jgi:hypothetical protein
LVAQNDFIEAEKIFLESYGNYNTFYGSEVDLNNVIVIYILIKKVILLDRLCFNESKIKSKKVKKMAKCNDIF